MSIAEMTATELDESQATSVAAPTNEGAVRPQSVGSAVQTTSATPGSEAASAKGKPEAGSEGLSQFLARVLDQLSISSWLPSGVLVAGALLYVGLTQHKADLGSTLSALISVDVAQLALGIGLVVLATVATQAFEFRAIRTLEGYWGPGRFKTWVTGRLCGYQLWRKTRLEKRMVALKVEAIDSAIEQMLANGVKAKVIEAFRALEDARSVSGFEKEDVAAAEKLDWQDYAALSDIRGYFSIGQYLGRYPAERRHTLPTRLGNVLRSHELAADDGKDDLEGLAQRLYARVPSHLQVTHDSFRSRLDLYCTMVFVLLVGALAAPMLAWTDQATGWLAGAVCLALSALCYRAAIASADGYGQVLNSMANHVRKADERVS